MQLILICPSLCYWYQRLLAVGWNHPLGKKGVICLVGLTVWRPLYVVQSRGFSSEIYDGVWGEGEWSGGHDEEFWWHTGQPSLYQHLPLSFLHPQLAAAQTSYWIHSPWPSPLACLHYLLSKEIFFSRWYVLCKSQLCGNSTWQTLADLLNSPPIA